MQNYIQNHGCIACKPCLTNSNTLREGNLADTFFDQNEGYVHQCITRFLIGF